MLSRRHDLAGQVFGFSWTYHACRVSFPLYDPFLASSMQSASGLSAADAAIIGASIAAGVTLLTAVLNGLIQKHLASQKERTTATEARADRITQQLSRLYGPLVLHTTQSYTLAKKLREDKPNSDHWHLLDHLDEVVEQPTDKALAEQIISINEEIEKLIFAHAGLVKDGEVPKSFDNFLGHHRLLKIAYEDAEAKRPIRRDVTAGRFETYPRDFDSDVRSTYDSLLAERKGLLGE